MVEAVSKHCYASKLTVNMLALSPIKRSAIFDSTTCTSTLGRVVTLLWEQGEIEMR